MAIAGKTAIVTGAGSGIGRATAVLFAAEGARVALFERDAETGAQAEAAIRESGGEAAFFAVDMCVPDQVAAAVQAVVARWGRLDILVNVAGGSGRKWGDGPAAECSLEGWQRTLELNLTSVFLSCKYAIPHLLAAGGGAIVNVSSVLGLVGGDRDFATHAYAASKGGIISLTRAMAVYYAPQHLRANVICPGLIATAMSVRAQASPEIRRRLPELQPLTGDFGRPEDVAQAVLYLASDSAAFVTGAVLTVDGGWTAH